MSDLATLIHGSAHQLPDVATGTVQAVVTSPPYFGLRKYDGDQDVEWPEVSYSPMAGLPTITVPAMTCPLGNESTIEAYIGHLVLCLREWWRVLRNDGLMFVNLGDSYAGSWGNYAPTGKGGQRERTKDGERWQRPGYEGTEAVRPATSLKQSVTPKNLILVPARFALAAQAEGWTVRNDIIWAKGVSFCDDYSGSVMPESVKDRATRAHEYIFMLAKSPKYYYNLEAVREPLAESTVKRYRRGWNSSGERGYIDGPQHHMKKFMDNETAKQESVKKGRNIRDVFAISPAGYAGAHFAVWPERLVEPMVKASTRPGDIVLDPFSGSGTTGRVSARLGRRYIGVDICAEYLGDMTAERLTTQMVINL